MPRTTLTLKILAPAGLVFSMVAAPPLACVEPCPNGVDKTDGGGCNGGRETCLASATDTTSDTGTESGSGSESVTAGTATTEMTGTDSTNATEPTMSTTVETATTSTTVDTTSEGTTEDTTSTTGLPECDEDLICDEDMGEDIANCLQDCATCTPNDACLENEETPYSCPEDCAPKGCNNDGMIDALDEQCDDGNMEDTDACTNACSINVCGDGVLFPPEKGGAEECDDGNPEAGDGCSPECTVEKRFVFVSSKTSKGDLGGLMGADMTCSTLAMGKLPGTYAAWLGTNMGQSAEAHLGLQGFKGMFVLKDETPVAMGWNGLTTTTLLHAIDQDEDGAMPTSDVWTNTNADGTITGADDCAGWTNNTSSKSGAAGATDTTSEKWTKNGTSSCSAANHLYCFQVE